MITGTLLIILITIVTTLLGLLPNMTLLPESFTNAWDWFSGFIANFFWVIPSGITLLTILNIIIIIEFSIFVYRTINWVINKLRGSGS